MEAAEVAVAERPSGETCQATAAELTREGQAWFDPQRFLPFNASFDVTTPIKWIRAEDLDTGKPIWLPVDVVDMDGERSDIPNISKSSNGLASGNTLEDARFHALCELIERDGTTLWSLLPEDARQSTCFDARGLDCVAVDEIVTRISYAGFRINLFNQQSDVGIPVVMAVLGPADDNGHVGQLEITAGYGAHPDAGQAALRAITEAAQSRVTAIAASRDDIHSASFRNAADASSLALLTALPDGRAPVSQSNALEAGMLVDRLTAAGCAVCAVTISPPDASFFAVRVVSPDLEDRGANLNWRPGWRSFDALERLP
jgi:ribosomal protein S12 methylthiotransferase accessory factor